VSGVLSALVAISRSGVTRTYDSGAAATETVPTGASQVVITAWGPGADGADGDATTGGFVFEQGTSTFDDNGTAVSMDVRTKDFMLSPSKKSKWKYIYLKYGTGFTGTLTVNTRAEKTVNFTLQKSISLAGTSPGLGPTGTFTLGTSVLGGADVAKQRVNLAEVTGSLFGIRFREITSSNCELFDYSVLGFKKGYRDS